MNALAYNTGSLGFVFLKWIPLEDELMILLSGCNM